jgi:hypothetical protein
MQRTIQAEAVDDIAYIPAVDGFYIYMRPGRSRGPERNRPVPSLKVIAEPGGRKAKLAAPPSERNYEVSRSH